MNYRHAYHAGGFSDVLKHLVLVALLLHLKQKAKPFRYIETHAGAGLYHLDQNSLASHTAEFKWGIQKLVQAADQERTPIWVRQYIDLVKVCGYPNTYPGSPLIASTLLGEGHRLLLSEIHPEIYAILLQTIQNSQAQSMQQEGFAMLKALLPPQERRGLILIDPPFESTREWQDLIQVLQRSLKKFSTGIYLVWFPIKDLGKTDRWLAEITALNPPKAFVLEWIPYKLSTYWGLSACGLVIINLPWYVQNGLMEHLNYLNRTLGSVEGRISMRRL